MQRMRRSITGLVCLSIILAGGFTVGSMSAQSEELKAVLRIAAADEPAMDMEYSLGPDRVRLDVPQGMSLIWKGGASPTILILMHAQNTYLEMAEQQLKMMAQMLQASSTGGSDQPSAIDPSQMQFETTSNHEQVSLWDAVEVIMSGPAGQEGSLWFTTDVETGLFELMARAAGAASALQMPMASGGMAAAQQFLRYEAIADAAGLPEGRVVRIDSVDGDQSSSITLASLEPGPLPADTFEAPAGYKQQMGFPGAPGARE